MSEHTLLRQEHSDSTAVFGFWVYLMTDCVLFAALFAVYAVLRTGTFGGPGGSEIFNLPNILVETFLLLTSSYTCGLAMLAAHKGRRNEVVAWFGATFVLGFSFLALELSEFHQLLLDGNGPDRSAFLSSYFTLVGTHGLHITIGLLWMLVLMSQVLKRGLKPMTLNRLALLSLFWHFLDLIWIFIFTIVYLMGAK
ncbi:MAG: cytochrome o ubiquinol oxidase subunit III [bacterium]